MKADGVRERNENIYLDSRGWRVVSFFGKDTGKAPSDRTSGKRRMRQHPVEAADTFAPALHEKTPTEAAIAKIAWQNHALAVTIRQLLDCAEKDDEGAVIFPDHKARTAFVHTIFTLSVLSEQLALAADRLPPLP